MSALMIVALAAIAGPWLIVLVPIVAGLFLLAPPIWIYKHDETPVPRTDVTLEGVAIEPGSSGSRRFLLVLVNSGDVPADDFRIRLLVPQSLVPATMSSRLLGTLHTGTTGRNWFVDSTYDAIAITFRAGASDQIVCPPHHRLELADLNLPEQSPQVVDLEYQISGGSASPRLGRLHLRQRSEPSAP